MNKFKGRDLDFRGYVVNHKVKDYDLKIKDRVKNNIETYRQGLIETAKSKDVTTLHQLVQHMFCQLISENEVETLMSNLIEGDIEDNVDKYLNIYKALYKHGFYPYIF